MLRTAHCNNFHLFDLLVDGYKLKSKPCLPVVCLFVSYMRVGMFVTGNLCAYLRSNGISRALLMLPSLLPFPDGKAVDI